MPTACGTWGLLRPRSCGTSEFCCALSLMLHVYVLTGFCRRFLIKDAEDDMASERLKA